MADVYKVAPWQMGKLTPLELEAIDGDVDAALKRRSLDLGGG